MSQYCKMYRYTQNPIILIPELAPIDLDYKVGLTSNLHAKRTIVLGEVVQVYWYGEYDAGTDIFVDLVLKVDIAYTRNPLGLALFRDTTRVWLLEDETDAEPVKVTHKIYRGNERTAELARRAENGLAMQNTLGLAKIIQDQVVNHGKTEEEAISIGLGYADTWYDHFEAEIRKFQRTNSRVYWDAIQELRAVTPNVPAGLEWAVDTPDFLSVVSDEVNFRGWV